MLQAAAARSHRGLHHAHTRRDGAPGRLHQHRVTRRGAARAPAAGRLGKTEGEAPFSADIEVVALDRQGLLRDITEAIARERINVTAVNTLSKGAHAFMRFTLQVSSADGIQRVLRQVKDVPGVDAARRL